jgi:hypothetical protein
LGASTGRAPCGTPLRRDSAWAHGGVSPSRLVIELIEIGKEAVMVLIALSHHSKSCNLVGSSSDAGNLNHESEILIELLYIISRFQIV